MFTIKHVSPGEDHDVVRLWEGRNPIFEHDKVEFDVVEGLYYVHCSIDTGIVYVMNAAGKTVDTFRLKGADLLDA